MRTAKAPARTAQPYCHPKEPSNLERLCGWLAHYKQGHTLPCPFCAVDASEPRPLQAGLQRFTNCTHVLHVA